MFVRLSLIISLLFLFCLSANAQKKRLSKKALEERIDKLEKDNAILKAELKDFKKQLQIIMQRLPQKKEMPTDTLAHTTVEFEKLMHDFGTVQRGESVSYTFKFKNTGDQPFQIQDVRSSCGCTIPDWKKAPILVGEQGEITVVFNSAGKLKQQEKTVRIVANTAPNPIILIIKAYVKR